MINLKDFEKILSSSGFPVAYLSWPENGAPQMPYICYYVSGSNNFAADGIVYYPIIQIQVELYTELKDLKAENALETALSSFYWNKTETYIDTENCYQIAYEIEV